MAEIVGWFSLKGGAHIPILKGQSKSEAAQKYFASKHGNTIAKLTSKGSSEKVIKKNSMKVISDEELIARKKEIYAQQDKLYAQKQKELESLSPSERWEKEIEIEDKYRKLLNETPTAKSISDSRSIEKNMLLDNDNIFSKDLKPYDTNKETRGADKLTSEEQAALTHYTSQWGYGSYSNVNSYLYNPDKPMYGDDKAKAQEATKTLDSAMSKCTLGQNCVVYRGIEPSKLNNPEVEKAVTKLSNATTSKKGTVVGLEKTVAEANSLKGTIIENKGFVSTSTYMDSNYSQRGVTLVINAKASDNAIDVRNLSKYGGKQDTFMAAFSKGGIQKESEVLFDRNTNLIVRDIAVTSSGVQILCDTVQSKSNNFKYKSRKKVDGEWVYEY